MSARAVFNFLFGAPPLPSKEFPSTEETIRLSTLLNRAICPSCKSKDVIGIAPSQKVPGDSDYICHVCGEGWQVTPNEPTSVRMVRPLGVVISSFNKAYLAGDTSDKHQPYYDE